MANRVVERVRADARLGDGFVLVSTMHITASVFVNDRESGLWEDIMAWLEEIAPREVPQIRPTLRLSGLEPFAAA